MSTEAVKKCKIFKCQQHAENISKRLQTFYKQQEFCDITLISAMDDVKIEAHRIVLSASSDYFLAMSRSTLKESKDEVIQIYNIDGNIFKLIVDFMYTASIELCSETVESVLKAADFFQMNTLIAACCDFMCEQLDPCNCLGIAFLAEQHSYTELHQKCLSFAYKHFEELCTEQEFLQLNEEQLNKFLSSDDLRVVSQEKLFNSLALWFQHDEVNRAKSIFKLLSRHVRFELLKPKFIIANSEKVSKTFECSELMLSWVRWHILPESRENYKKKLSLVFRKNDEFSIQVYNPELNQWSHEMWPQKWKQPFGFRTILIAANWMIFENIESHILECLDLQTNEHTILPSMGLQGSRTGMTELNGDLYIFIDSSDSYEREYSSSYQPFHRCKMQKYDVYRRRWQQLSPVPDEFKSFNVVVLNGLLYVAGINQYHVNCYDPLTDKWTQTASKNDKSCNFGMISINEDLYAIGGEYRSSRQKCVTVERYNTSSNTWTVMEPLNAARSGIFCTVANNRILACGGKDINDKYVNDVEEYNPETGKWIKLASFLTDRSPPLIRAIINCSLD